MTDVGGREKIVGGGIERVVEELRKWANKLRCPSCGANLFDVCGQEGDDVRNVVEINDALEKYEDTNIVCLTHRLCLKPKKLFICLPCGAISTSWANKLRNKYCRCNKGENGPPNADQHATSLLPPTEASAGSASSEDHGQEGPDAPAAPTSVQGGILLM